MPVVIPSKAMVNAVRSIRSRTHPAEHVHEFVEDMPCPCRRTFDQVVGTDEPLVLELNPTD